MNPNNEKDALDIPAQWITHAESDLRLGRLGADDPAVLREQVCFHAQQATEKALKAVLLSREIEFPYTHDIKGLLRIAETNGVAIPPAIKQASLLTPYAVETRYLQEFRGHRTQFGPKVVHCGSGLAHGLAEADRRRNARRGTPFGLDGLLGSSEPPYSPLI